jgi:hypothetical protein
MRRRTNRRDRPVAFHVSRNALEIVFLFVREPEFLLEEVVMASANPMLEKSLNNIEDRQQTCELVEVN